MLCQLIHFLTIFNLKKEKGLAFILKRWNYSTLWDCQNKFTNEVLQNMVLKGILDVRKMSISKE